MHVMVNVDAIHAILMQCNYPSANESASRKKASAASSYLRGAQQRFSSVSQRTLAGMTGMTYHGGREVQLDVQIRLIAPNILMLAHRFWTAPALFAFFVSQVGDPKNWV